MILDILKAAKEKISDPEKWCQNVIAQDTNGNACDFYSPDACKWCAAGAIWSTGQDTGLTRDALQFLSKVSIDLPEAAKLSHKSTFEVNDSLGHETVMKLFDFAISRLEGEDGKFSGNVSE